MEQNKSTAKEKLNSFVSEYSKGKFISSIVMSIIALAGVIVSLLTFSGVQSIIKGDTNAVAAFFAILIGIAGFGIGELVTIIFSSIGLSLASFNFKAVKNAKTIIMFVLTLAELLTAITLIVLLFIL